MADNVAITAGSGTSIAADDISSVFYQRVKLSIGADGEAADLDHGQATMAASLPVVIASNQSAVPVSDGSSTLSVDDGGGALTVDGTVAVSGTVAVTDNSGSLTVDGDVTVTSPDTVITVTPTCDTNAYASGDLLFDSTEIAAAVRSNGSTAILQSVTIIDKDDQGVAFTLIFANAATDFGTLNSAPDPDDTEAATVIGHVPVATTDYIDLGGAKVACIRNIGLLLKAGASTTSLYVAAMNGTGTPTFSASGLVLQIGLLRS